MTQFFLVQIGNKFAIKSIGLAKVHITLPRPDDNMSDEDYETHAAKQFDEYIQKQKDLVPVLKNSRVVKSDFII